MEALSYDVIVVGGGPAGTSTAIAVARGGFRVLLLEKGQFPRHKVCGEFVSAESLGVLSSLLDPEHAGLLEGGIPIPQARVFLDGRVLKTGVTPAARSIARFDLDLALWDTATRAGVDARLQTTVQNVSGDGPFRVVTSAGEFQGLALVNASGRWSNLTVQSDAPREKWLGLKAHFSEGAPERSVDLYFFEGGYCGVQPVDLRGLKQGRVNAAAMVRADVASSLPEMFARHPQLWERSRGWKALSETVSTSPLIFRTPQPVRGNVFLVGDAAGFVDPFVGDGISLAIRSGALAAESLVRSLGGGSLATGVAEYTRAYADRLGPVFRSSSTIRRLLMMPRAIRVPLLLALEKMPAVTRYMVAKTR